MGCRICLDAYTPDERPAALPCGHVFHHACLQDWLTTRTHGAVPSGCPLCKAPAALTDLVPLWASDTDLKQYVAAHPPDGRLSSMHAWVRHLHDYAIATHQLCPPAMSRAAAALPSALPDEARHALQDAMHALHDAVVHTDRLSRDLAQRMHALDERTRRTRSWTCPTISRAPSCWARICTRSPRPRRRKRGGVSRPAPPPPPPQPPSVSCHDARIGARHDMWVYRAAQQRLVRGACLSCGLFIRACTRNTSLCGRRCSCCGRARSKT